MTKEKLIKCPVQGDDVTEEWCDYAQYAAVCSQCVYSKNRVESRYQREIRLEKKTSYNG